MAHLAFNQGQKEETDKVANLCCPESGGWETMTQWKGWGMLLRCGAKSAPEIAAALGLAALSITTTVTTIMCC